jgi:Tfp pilus assembly protein PilO
MALNKRERVLLRATLGVLFIGANWLLVGPLYGRWADTRRDLLARRRELDAMKATIALAPQWQEEYDRLRGSFAQSTARFNHTSEVLKKVEEVGQQAGVAFTARRPLPEGNTGAVRELPVSCSVEASTEALVRFLYNIQSASGFMSVEQLQVVPRPDNPSLLRCDVQIRALSSRGEGSGS